MTKGQCQKCECKVKMEKYTNKVVVREVLEDEECKEYKVTLFNEKTNAA